VGIALWLTSALLSFALARLIPAGRRRPWFGELVTALLAGMLLGVLATALDFGGWAELDWRAALFVFLGSLAAVAVFRHVSLE
jgi:hypothetical protein